MSKGVHKTSTRNKRKTSARSKRKTSSRSKRRTLTRSKRKTLTKKKLKTLTTKSQKVAAPPPTLAADGNPSEIQPVAEELPVSRESQKAANTLRRQEAPPREKLTRVSLTNSSCHLLEIFIVSLGFESRYLRGRFCRGDPLAWKLLSE